MILGITGSRNGVNKNAIKKFRTFLEKNNITEAHHGDCVGADKEIHDILKERNVRVVIHPPTQNILRAYCKGDEIKQAKPYLSRNKDIVDETDILVAFPSSHTEEVRSGTWSTIRYAKSKNKAMIIFFPDGSQQKFNMK